MAVGKGFFDQYSVFCVFGSVVGCVVVPLITQSVESVIFSAIVISLTATHLTKRASKSENSNQFYNTKEVDRRSHKKAKDRDAIMNGQNKKKKTYCQQSSASRSTDIHKRREHDFEKLELARQQELDRKLEERKERKVKKKEERMKKKELEKEEKEKEDQRLRKLKEERLKENLRQQEKIIYRQDRSRCTTPKSSKKTEHSLHKTSYQPNVPTVISLSALSRERASSESNDTSPSPPPSVWKVPEYVEPKWNPGKSDGKETTKLNNDVVFKKGKITAPFNQLYNPVHSNQSFCKNQYMNTEKSLSTNQEPGPGNTYCLLKDLDKPDNRHQGDFYSSFSGLPNILSQMNQSRNEEHTAKAYSLFGTDQPDSSVFRSPLTGL